MKTILPLFILFSCLFLSSCARNHYINNIPATPLFEKVGDMNGKIGLSSNHFEYQASISPLPFVGFSRTGMHGGGPFNQFNISSNNIHLYTRLGKLPLFMDLSGGLGKGSVWQKKWHLPIAQEFESNVWYSSFQKRELGLFIHYRHEYEMNMQIGLGLFYRDIRFSNLNMNYWKHDVGTIKQSIYPNQSFQSLNPVMVFSIQPEDHPSIGVDFSLSYQINLTPSNFLAKEEKTGMYVTPVSPAVSNTSIQAVSTPLLFATTFRLNTNFVRIFRKMRRH